MSIRNEKVGSDFQNHRTNFYSPNLSDNQPAMDSNYVPMHVGDCYSGHNAMSDVLGSRCGGTKQVSFAVSAGSKDSCECDLLTSDLHVQPVQHLLTGISYKSPKVYLHSLDHNCSILKEPAHRVGDQLSVEQISKESWPNGWLLERWLTEPKKGSPTSDNFPAILARAGQEKLP